MHVTGPINASGTARRLPLRAGGVAHRAGGADIRLDGRQAAANTVIRKRAVLHGALGYAAEAGLLPDNPLDSIGWRVPQSSAALDPAIVANPDQVNALLDAAGRGQDRRRLDQRRHQL